jgi:hypothetical protein
MTYRCQQCGRTFDDQFAIGSRLTCPRACGGKLESVVLPDLADLGKIRLTDLPYPVALTTRRLIDAPGAPAEILKTLLKVRDCFESTIKYLGAILLGGYFRDPSRNADQDEILLENLTRPTLDAWVSLVVDDLSPCVLASEDELASRIAALFCRPLTGGRAKANRTSLSAECKDFVNYRNDALGDGAARSDRAYSDDLRRWLPTLTRLLAEVSALADWRLCLVADCDRCQIWMGPQPDTATVPGSFRRDQIGRFVVCGRTGGEDTPAEREARDLYPFVCYLPDRNQEQRLHFCDSINRYRETRKEASVLEYDNGFRTVSAVPVSGLEESFTAEALSTVVNSHRGRMEVIEGRVANFGELLAAHADVVGRHFVVEHVRKLLTERDRGMLIIEAEPGKGKTALIAHLAEKVFGDYEPPAVHFFYRRTAGITDPDVCVRSLYWALREAHHIAEAEESKQQPEGGSAFHRLTKLLTQHIVPRLLPDRRQLILVDALDEADHNREAFQCLTDPPAGVYVIATTRPVPNRTLLARGRNLEWYNLDDPELLQENLRDGGEYVERELASSGLPNETLDEIARVGGGNFLVLKHLCHHVRGILEPVEVSEYVKRLATDGAADMMGFIYQGYWERITSRLDPDDLNLLREVAGVLVIAQAAITAEMVCDALSLRGGDWDFALRHLVEYLTVIREEEQGVIETFYRIYHESFADFIRSRILTEEDRRRLHGLMADCCLRIIRDTI